MTIPLPKRQGEFAVYENERTGVRFHIEKTSQRGLYGVENITDGYSICPRTLFQLQRFVAKHALVFVELGR
jgi:hypothetical protein